MKNHIERILKVWAGQQRCERGDSFATVEEMKMLCDDPMLLLRMLRGYDAFDVLSLAYEHECF